MPCALYGAHLGEAVGNGPLWLLPSSQLLWVFVCVSLCPNHACVSGLCMWTCLHVYREHVVVWHTRGNGRKWKWEGCLCSWEGPFNKMTSYLLIWAQIHTDSTHPNPTISTSNQPAPSAPPPTTGTQPRLSVCGMWCIYAAWLQQLSRASYKITSNHNCYSQFSDSSGAESEPSIDSFKTCSFGTKHEKQTLFLVGWSGAEVKRDVIHMPRTYAPIISTNTSLLYVHK